MIIACNDQDPSGAYAMLNSLRRIEQVSLEVSQHVETTVAPEALITTIDIVLGLRSNFRRLGILDNILTSSLLNNSSNASGRAGAFDTRRSWQLP